MILRRSTPSLRRGPKGNSKGQQEWITPGTYNFTVPADVTAISAICIGGGGGAGGGWGSNGGGTSIYGVGASGNETNLDGSVVNGSFGFGAGGAGGRMGTNGAVRIIWGDNRSYPTNAA